MNLEQQVLHLSNVHQYIIDVMSPVIGIQSPSPIEVILRPLLVAGGLTIDPPRIYICRDGGKDILYKEEEMSYKEFTMAHETAHYLHFQNCNKAFKRYSKREDSFEGTKRSNRQNSYNELTAEFFSCLYFGLEERALTLILFAKEGLLDPERLDLYFSKNSIDERKEICRWLITHSYEQVKRNFKRGPLKKEFKKLVMDDWKV